MIMSFQDKYRHDKDTHRVLSLSGVARGEADEIPVECQGEDVL